MKLESKGHIVGIHYERLLVKRECSEALGPFFKYLSLMAARYPAFKRLMRAHGLSQATV